LRPFSGLFRYTLREVFKISARYAGFRPTCVTLGLLMIAFSDHVSVSCLVRLSRCEVLVLRGAEIISCVFADEGRDRVRGP